MSDKEQNQLTSAMYYQYAFYFRVTKTNAIRIDKWDIGLCCNRFTAGLYIIDNHSSLEQ